MASHIEDNDVIIWFHLTEFIITTYEKTPKHQGTSSKNIYLMIEGF